MALRYKLNTDLETYKTLKKEIDKSDEAIIDPYIYDSNDNMKVFDDHLLSLETQTEEEATTDPTDKGGKKRKKIKHGCVLRRQPKKRSHNINSINTCTCTKVPSCDNQKQSE